MLSLLFLSGRISYARGDVSTKNDDGSLPTPFTNILQNTGNSFMGYNILFHAGGIAGSYLIIQSDLDYEVHNYFARNKKTYDLYSFPAVWIGYAAPFALGGTLYMTGLLREDSQILGAGCAVLQASLIAFTYTSILKSITGRPSPDPGVYTHGGDQSGEFFKWGILRNGINNGWPSGHMSVSTAIISSMIYYYPDSILVKIAGGIAWSYMFFGVMANGGGTMHWFSDAAAGSLMGFAIGSTVGDGFRNRRINRPGTDSGGGISFSPVITPVLAGIVVTIPF